MSLAAKTPAPRASLADWWTAWRNALVRRPGFQRWAAGFPLTRRVAQRKAGDLFDLVAGFVYSQVLAAIVRLEILEAVERRPLSAEALAARTGLPEASARRLCTAAATLGLLAARADGTYGLGEKGAALLGNPGIAAMVRHHALLYDDLRDPVALLRGEPAETALSGFWAYARASEPGALAPESVAEYSRLMAVSQDFIAAEILDAWPLRDTRILLDVGGGEGAFARAAAARWPHLAVRVFDLPAVAERARATFAQAGLGARAQAFGGDLFRDALPEGAEVASLVRVLYDHPRERALAILRAVHAALPPGGRLLVAEPMAGTAGAEAMGSVYFSFYLLAMRGGDPRSPGEIAGLLAEAGFAESHAVKTRRPLFTSLVVARK